MAERKPTLRQQIEAIDHPCHDVCIGNLHADCQCAAWIRQEALSAIGDDGAEWECGSELDGHRCSRPMGHKGMHRKRSMLGPTQEALHAAYNQGFQDKNCG